jgi:hypothetical protein
MVRQKVKASQPVQVVKWVKRKTNRGIKYAKKTVESPSARTSNPPTPARYNSEQDSDANYQFNVQEPIPLKIPGGKVCLPTFLQTNSPMKTAE